MSEPTSAPTVSKNLPIDPDDCPGLQAHFTREERCQLIEEDLIASQNVLRVLVAAITAGVILGILTVVLIVF